MEDVGFLDRSDDRYRLRFLLRHNHSDQGVLEQTLLISPPDLRRQLTVGFACRDDWSVQAKQENCTVRIDRYALGQLGMAINLHLKNVLIAYSIAIVLDIAESNFCSGVRPRWLPGRLTGGGNARGQDEAADP